MSTKMKIALAIAAILIVMAFSRGGGGKKDQTIGTQGPRTMAQR